MIVFNFLSKLHLIHIIFIFSLLFNTSHDIYFYEHGMYNIIVFLILFILNFIIILIIKVLILFFHLQNKIIIYKVVLIFVLLIFYVFEFSRHFLHWLGKRFK